MQSLETNQTHFSISSQISNCSGKMLNFLWILLSNYFYKVQFFWCSTVVFFLLSSTDRIKVCLFDVLVEHVSGCLMEKNQTKSRDGSGCAQANLRWIRERLKEQLTRKNSWFFAICVDKLSHFPSKKFANLCMHHFRHVFFIALESSIL